MGRVLRRRRTVDSDAKDFEAREVSRRGGTELSGIDDFVTRDKFDYSGASDKGEGGQSHLTLDNYLGQLRR